MLIDGSVVGTFAPSSTSYQSYSTVAFPLIAGTTPKITFQGLASAGGDNTAFIDQVAVATPSSPSIGDPGFEQPVVGAGQFQYDPTGSPWAFSGLSGISGNNSGFTSGNPNAPQGAQVALLQGTGSFTQSVTGWAAGSYVLTFDAAQRGNFGVSQQNLEVLIDGSVVGTFTPSSTSYQSYSTVAFPVTAGTHTIEFQGLSASGANTAFIDAVSISSTSPSPAPAVTGLNPTSGPRGGTPVTITGTSFTGATAVDFGTAAATGVTVVNDNTITATSPAGTGIVDVTVTTPAGTSATSPADQFTYTAVAAGGHAHQPDHRSHGRRHFGDDHRHQLHRRHGGRLRHDGGDGRHGGERHHDHGRQPGGHRHRGRDRDHPGQARRPPRPPISSPTPPLAPAVTLISPTTGPPAGGTLVTITGTGFTGATAVDFGTTAATGVTVVNDTTITAVSPAGTGTVDVTVTTPVGTSATVARRSVHLHRRHADGHAHQPDHRSARRRHYR